MIKKLRIKLILVSMFSLMAVLGIIMGTIGMLNYRKVITDADRTLSILAENDGTFPENDGTFPENGMHQLSPELRYETRYFSVLIHGDTIFSVNTGKIAAVDTTAAMEYAEKALMSGKNHGFIGDYRYAISSSYQGSCIIFLDCGRSLGIFYNFVVTSMAVSSVGLIAVFLLMLFLSRWIVKPFSENYEKQKRFITDAGHELKTPLAIINADTEVLEMDFGENEWLSDIQAQTQRLAELTGSLTLLARMEEAQPENRMIEFSFSDLAEEELNAFQSLAKVQKKHLYGDIQPMLSMCGDEAACRRLISILLDNAVKYTPEGGRIDLGLKKQKRHLHLTVFNTAEHISREQLPYLFGRFYRTDESRNSQTGGYGLGLSIASAIVSAHKGKITASTEDEHSLSITATFPVF